MLDNILNYGYALKKAEQKLITGGRRLPNTIAAADEGGEAVCQDGHVVTTATCSAADVLAACECNDGIASFQCNE